MISAVAFAITRDVARSYQPLQRMAPSVAVKMACYQLPFTGRLYTVFTRATPTRYVARVNWEGIQERNLSQTAMEQIYNEGDIEKFLAVAQTRGNPFPAFQSHMEQAEVGQHSQCNEITLKKQ